MQDFVDLEKCSLHPQETKHFYCKEHKTLICRQCRALHHSKGRCKTIDVYEIEENQQFNKLFSD